MASFNPTISENLLNFNSAKSRQTAFAVWVPALLVLASAIITFFFEDLRSGAWFSIIIFAIINVTICWMWFDTGYEITETNIQYHSGPMKGKIAIESIRKIEKKKEIFSGINPALGNQGIVVHYNNYDDIYLSPEKQEDFIRELISRNPDIQVTN